ncbi:MAG: AmmeMemoRadiSam system radical SAM enzyme [Dehalococcoidia bacterium]|nr:AmmeMemoRadiSam system radical SAM enzyme [Dehalococcoidia bacterium]
MKEALLYERLTEGRVRCNLCAHRCVIFPGRVGICRVRENREGKLYTHVYGRIVSQHVDPIEKKPLFHFYPGSTSYSIATVGCNFHCLFCQNWEVSQVVSPEQFLLGEEVTPEEIVERAQMLGCRSIAYTYTEPTVFFEYALDTAEIARSHGLRNILVTNGYETPEAIEVIRPYLDAANVDLKSFSDQYYRKVVGATLKPVLDTIRLLKALGIWVEVTTLVVPGRNDSPEEMRAIARFLSHDVGRDTPWHISRFFPAYKMSDLPPTDISTLHEARLIGLEEGLDFVYIGNVPGAQNTFCPGCAYLLIIRDGLFMMANRTVAGRCPRCGRPLVGVGLDWQQEAPAEKGDDRAVKTTV